MPRNNDEFSGVPALQQKTLFITDEGSCGKPMKTLIPTYKKVWPKGEQIDTNINLDFHIGTFVAIENLRECAHKFDASIGTERIRTIGGSSKTNRYFPSCIHQCWVGCESRSLVVDGSLW